MGVKECLVSSLKDIGSGMVDTACAAAPGNNARGVCSGITKMAGGAFGIALGLTVGAVKLGSKAIQAGTEDTEED